MAPDKHWYNMDPKTGDWKLGTQNESERFVSSTVETPLQRNRTARTLDQTSGAELVRIVNKELCAGALTQAGLEALYKVLEPMQRGIRERLKDAVKDIGELKWQRINKSLCDPKWMIVLKFLTEADGAAFLSNLEQMPIGNATNLKEALDMILEYHVSCKPKPATIFEQVTGTENDQDATVAPLSTGMTAAVLMTPTHSGASPSVAKKAKITPPGKSEDCTADDFEEFAKAFHLVTGTLDGVWEAWQKSLEKKMPAKK